MCDDPQEKDGNTFACRICDACIAARRAGWVARCLAENTQHQHSVCVTLTYDDKAPGGYDAARFFAYHDVRAFVQRITAALRRVDRSLSVRFICAGEQGDRNSRCHWHLILWSDFDLRTLGEVSFQQSDKPCHHASGKRMRRGDVLTDPESMMTVGNDKRRLHWSLWARDKIPMGFVTFGAADEAGAKYVVSYCLKDQFTAEKSRGKARFTKSENFATGLFRMSKRPAIGEAWLMQQLSELEQIGAVLPNTHLKVPGLSGYWFPSARMREKLLGGFRAINEQRVASGLGVCPQWPGLLSACKDNPSDMEILIGPQTEQIAAEEAERARSKVILDAFGRWQADYFKETSPTVADQRDRFRAAIRCLCNSCVKEAYGTPQHRRKDGQDFFFAGGDKAELAGSEAVRETWGVGAKCQTCGSTFDLWAVDENWRQGLYRNEAARSSNLQTPSN